MWKENRAHTQAVGLQSSVICAAPSVNNSLFTKSCDKCTKLSGWIETITDLVLNKQKSTLCLRCNQRLGGGGKYKEFDCNEKKKKNINQ